MKTVYNSTKLLIFFSLLISQSTTFGQSAHKFLRKGDNTYLSGDYKAAEENYRKSLEAQSSEKGSFNLGNSIFKQQRYDDAIKQYDAVANHSKDITLRSNALYNKGNAHFWKKEYDKAVDAYKEALRLNPKDEEAKKNLAKAKKQLQEQQKQEQKNKQNQDKNKQDDKDKKDNKDQQNKDNKDQNQQNQQNQQPNQQQNQQQNQQPQQDLKKEDAKRMLQIMDDEERKVQQRLKKGTPRPSRSSKDW